MTITEQEVIEALRNVTPTRISKHAVEIDGRDFPVNQAFSIVTRTDVLECNTVVSRRLFQKLGFVVKRVG